MYRKLTKEDWDEMVKTLDEELKKSHNRVIFNPLNDQEIDALYNLWSSEDSNQPSDDTDTSNTKYRFTLRESVSPS